jgi:hypothetical protein
MCSRAHHYRSQQRVGQEGGRSLLLRGALASIMVRVAPETSRQGLQELLRWPRCSLPEQADIVSARPMLDHPT